MKILVPIDGSSFSKNSLAFLASRAALMDKTVQIELLVVLSSVPELMQLSGPKLKRFCDEEAEKVFAPARKFLAGKHLEVTEATLVGNPAEQITEEAARIGADLIIIGSRGHTALAGLFLGSVTSGVLSQTKIPVLIIRSQSTFLDEALKVGLAVDGSPYAMAAVHYVLKHRDLFGNNAQFSLLHVASDFASTVYPDVSGMALPALSDEEMRELQQKEFDETTAPLVPLFSAAGYKPHLVGLAGNPGDEIAAYAKKAGLDIIVMGSHGYGRIKSAVMGSTALRIASQGDVPILIIQE